MSPRATSRLENQLYAAGYQVVAGLDEVGRGAWAGPVVAAAAILPRRVRIGKVFDSKAVTKMQRAHLCTSIKKVALAYAIGEASAAEIDALGMTRALLRAYVRALEQLVPRPSIVLVDGWRLAQLPFEQRAIIKGDQQSKCIAAASIIAKEYRDALMTRLGSQFPGYGFDQHKGYGTRQHQEALRTYGVCKIHRCTFGWVRDRVEHKRVATV